MQEIARNIISLITSVHTMSIILFCLRLCLGQRVLRHKGIFSTMDKDVNNSGMLLYTYGIYKGISKIIILPRYCIHLLTTVISQAGPVE